MGTSQDGQRVFHPSTRNASFIEDPKKRRLSRIFSRTKRFEGRTQNSELRKRTGREQRLSLREMEFFQVTFGYFFHEALSG